MHGLYLLWWVEEKHLSAAIVATILAVGDLVLMALEVPTGRFADRFGHRTSLIAGSLVQTVGMLFCWLGQDVPDLIAASVLVALGDGLRSGADQALLYRTCRAPDRESDFQQVEARTKAVELVALVGLVLAGGAIVEAWGYATGWILETGACALGLGIAFAMVEPPPCIERTTESPGSKTIAPWTLVALILPAAILGASSGAATFLAQTDGQRAPATVTQLVAVITLAEASGSLVAAKLPAAGASGQLLLSAVGALLIGVGVALPPAFVVVVVALSFLSGVAHPLRAAAIQRFATDDTRARQASVASACDMACTMIALPFAGFWRSLRSHRS